MAGERNVDVDSSRQRSARARGGGGLEHVDRAIAEIARRDHGVISRLRLLALGLTENQIDYRVRVGRLHPIHRGVYAVGHPRITQLGRWKAATLLGEDVVLSGGDAAGLWELPARRGGRVQVSSPHRMRRTSSVHPRRRRLPADERWVIDRIPVTSISRTLLDIAAADGLPALERALRVSERRQLGDAVGLPALAGRYPGARGTAVVARALERRLFTHHTRSELEDRFLEFLHARGYPRPLVNQIVSTPAGDFEVDFSWPGHALIVELDGWWSHGDPEAFERDRRRDAALLSIHRPVMRVTWERLHGDADALDAELATHFRASDDRPPPGA